MRMPNFATTKLFRAGLISGLHLFLAANVRSYWTHPCFYEEGRCGFGFPFECGYGFPFGPTVLDAASWGAPYRDEIFWGGLAANFFVAFIASTLLGLLCYKLFKSRPAFK